MPTLAKCINECSANKYLPKPLKKNKPYKVLETGLGLNGQFIKINNGGEEHIFHKCHFKLATTS